MNAAIDSAFVFHSSLHHTIIELVLFDFEASPQRSATLIGERKRFVLVLLALLPKLDAVVCRRSEWRSQDDVTSSSSLTPV